MVSIESQVTEGQVYIRRIAKTVEPLNRFQRE